MTEILIDKQFKTFGTSSALSAVYYSTEERKIFFEFLSGATAGYEGVNADIYTALETLNTNRLNGDSNASVGSYYNEFFRNTGYFRGVETSDLEFVTPEQASLRESINSRDIIVEEDLSDEYEQAVVEANIAPVSRRFGVAFVLDTEQEFSFNVFAEDENDALSRFKQAVALFGWNDVKIISLTRFFN